MRSACVVRSRNWAFFESPPVAIWPKLHLTLGKRAAEGPDSLAFVQCRHFYIITPPNRVDYCGTHALGGCVHPRCLISCNNQFGSRWRQQFSLEKPLIVRRRIWTRSLEAAVVDLYLRNNSATYFVPLSHTTEEGNFVLRVII